MGWFKTPKQIFIVFMLVLLTALSGAMGVMSLTAGTEILNHTYSEAVFEQEGLPADQVKSFTLESASLCEIEVSSPTVDQSWVWAMVRILDEKDRAVKDYSFNLSRYHGYEGGESWSESDDSESKTIRLPAGTYKVMISGEDALASDANARYSAQGYATIERDEKITVRVKKGVWLGRYFFGMFLIFGALAGLYIWWRSSRAQNEFEDDHHELYND